MNAGHTSAVNSVLLMNDQENIASCSTDGTIRLWKIKTGHCWGTLSGLLLLS